MKIDPEQDYRPVNLRHKVRTSLVLPILIGLLPVAAVAFVYRAELVQLVKAKFGTPQVTTAQERLPANDIPTDAVGVRLSPRAPFDSSAARQASRRDSIDSRARSRNLAKLQELASTCRFWRARSNEENTDALRQAACDTARNFALSIGEPMPYIGYRSAKPMRQQSGTPMLTRVIVPDCAAVNRYGSISYRQCRADVKAWLHRWCLQLAQANNAPGSRPQDKNYARQQAVCSADEQYTIVN